MWGFFYHILDNKTTNLPFFVVFWIKKTSLPMYFYHILDEKIKKFYQFKKDRIVMNFFSNARTILGHMYIKSTKGIVTKLFLLLIVCHTTLKALVIVRPVLYVDG